MGILIVTVPVLLAQVAALVPEATLRHAVIAHLARRFPGVTHSRNGEVAITGLAFLAKNASLHSVSSPTLARLVPNMHFYTTVTDTPYMEYMQVETLASATAIPGGVRVESMLSPAFENNSDTFLSQFEGTVVREPSDRIAFTRGITELLAEITWCGRVDNPHCSLDECSADLWHDGMHWLEIKVMFASNQRVRRITARFPVPRRPRRESPPECLQELLRE